MTTTLPFRLVGEIDKSTLRTAFLAEAQEWAATWFAGTPQAELEIDAEPAPGSMDKDQWTIVGEAPDRWVAWQCPDDSWQDYARFLLASPVAPDAPLTPLIGALLQECLSDLATRLLTAAGVATDCGATTEGSLHSVRIGYGSGVVFANLSGGGLPQQRLALGGEVAAAFISRQSQPTAADPALAPRRMAIASGSTRLEVVLGQAELTVAELANVSPGDVIRIGASFREPLTVRTSDGLSILRAHLGTRNGRKAIQIIEKTS